MTRGTGDEVTPSRRPTVLLVVALAVAALVAATAAAALATGGSGSVGGQPVGAPAAAGPGGARTALPGLVAASADPMLAGFATAKPVTGAVARVNGPFDDRFELSGVRFDGRAVSGALTVTSDVSALLELEVLAGFYDRSGGLLGTARWTHGAEDGEGHEHAGPPEERTEFTVTVPPGLRDRAVSAAVGVPVLVNE
ncbi:MAG TPA: hypothetical protein VES95_13575 [Dermatophilaceae bacterium]|nr:hypothetical protein [Dermatophilaceae bacterium]